jgi:hypothetical protein
VKSQVSGCKFELVVEEIGYYSVHAGWGRSFPFLLLEFSINNNNIYICIMNMQLRIRVHENGVFDNPQKKKK